MVHLLRRVWRTIPRPLRRSALSAANSFLAPALIRPSDYRPGPVTVAGLLRTATGLGQGARLCLSALQELRLEPRHVDLGKVFRWHDTLELELGQEARRGEGGALIVHVNAHQLPLALLGMGRGLIRHKRIIGHWVWELADIPPSWKVGFRFVDEIWVPSRFVADAVRPHSDVPVRIVPYPVRCPVRSRLTRSDFGFPDKAFVCLTMFDIWSGFRRKNATAVIRAFRMAFGEDSDAMLVLKVNNKPYALSAAQDLEREINGAANIKLLRDTLKPDDLAALIDCADVYLSLHRSEGFGLPLAEAMFLGKPVIATNWSGNTDFMSKRNSALVDFKLIPVQDSQGIYTQSDQLWAEPDIEQAAQWLRVLAEDEELRRRIGETAARDTARYFDLDVYRDAVGDLAPLA